MQIDGVRWVSTKVAKSWPKPHHLHVGQKVAVTTITSRDPRRGQLTPIGFTERIDTAGVHIRFPGPVHGITTAYATHDELHAVR